MQIIRKANELGEDALALSGRFCQEFLDDMADLQCLPPTHQPRVSDHMDQIKNMITQVVCVTLFPLSCWMKISLSLSPAHALILFNFEYAKFLNISL